MIDSALLNAPYQYPSDPPRSFDCWTLLVWVRKQLGLETPLPIDAADFDPTTLGQAIDAVTPCWQRVDIPRDGDAVLFHRGHIGVVLGSGVLHAPGGVAFTHWPVLKRRWPRYQVWRP